MRAWLIWWVLLAALWLALVDTVVVPELVAGAVAAAIAATGAVVVRGQRRRAAAPAGRRGRGTRSGRCGARSPTSARSRRALWRRGIRRRDERGAIAEVPYAAVGDEPGRHGPPRVHPGARARSRPNTLVVGVDAERRVLLVHELVPTDDPAARAKPLPDP